MYYLDSLMDLVIAVFFLVGSWFLLKAASRFKAEEMLIMLKVSRELDFQYDRVVTAAVNTSKTAESAVDALKKEVRGTVLDIGERNYEMDVKSEWGYKKCSQRK